MFSRQTPLNFSATKRVKFFKPSLISSFFFVKYINPLIVVVNIGEACEDDDFDCTEDNFARCNSKNVCECDNRFTKNNETCEPTLSAYCKEDNHCRVENSNCRNGFCNCKPNYKPNKASTKCLPDFL